jgi:hypothetical protein
LALIFTTLGYLDESALQKTEGGIDNDVEATTWVEYCLRDCPNPVHQTRQPAQPEYFCPKHIHRSVGIALKTGVSAAAAAEGF